MKKILLFASALAGLFLAGSCQRENLEPMGSANTVTYTVTVPDALATKGIGDDISAVDELVYEVYRTQEEGVETFTNLDNFLYHKTAEYGVVRNHVYQIDINSISGYGSPVYNGLSHILTPGYPELEQESYVAARINVLSWKVVQQGVDIETK